MMNNIMVSVVMPTYKQTNFMHDAVQSVLNQTYKNIELIVVDDNTDENIKKNNAEYFESLKCEKIRYIQNDMNIGSAKSRNKGILISQGKYITFLDDDDYYVLDKISKQVNLMEENCADYSVCNLKLINDNGKIVDIRKRKYLRKKEELIVKHLKYHITGTDTFMFKKDVLLQVGMFDEVDLGDEFYLMQKAINFSSKFVHMDEIGAIARVHKNEGLSGFKSKLKSEQMLQEHIERNYTNLRRKDKRYISMRHHCVNAVAYLKGGKIFNFFKEVILSMLISPFGLIGILVGSGR